MCKAGGTCRMTEPCASVRRPRACGCRSAPDSSCAASRAISWSRLRSAACGRAPHRAVSIDHAARADPRDRFLLLQEMRRCRSSSEPQWRQWASWARHAACSRADQSNARTQRSLKRVCHGKHARLSGIDFLLHELNIPGPVLYRLLQLCHSAAAQKMHPQRGSVVVVPEA